MMNHAPAGDIWGFAGGRAKWSMRCKMFTSWKIMMMLTFPHIENCIKFLSWVMNAPVANFHSIHFFHLIKNSQNNLYSCRNKMSLFNEQNFEGIPHYSDKRFIQSFMVVFLKLECQPNQMIWFYCVTSIFGCAGTWQIIIKIF